MADDALRIVALDPLDDDSFAAFAEIQVNAAVGGAPYATPYPPVELRSQLLERGGSMRRMGYLGLDRAGEAVVAGMTMTRTADNLGQASLCVWVVPARRRQGFGSMMAAALIELAVASGQAELLARLSYPLDADESWPSRRFAAQHGFTLANTEVHRVLDLPVAASHLDDLMGDAAAKHQGYTFVEYVDDTMPEALLPSYLRLLNALSVEAPSGDIAYEQGGVTPQMWHADQAALVERGRKTYRTIALDAAGEAVAYTDLSVPLHDSPNVFQWDTLVRRGDRGHRLGMAVKLRTIRAVQRHHPDRTVIHTWNAASNSYMIAVNDAIGFRPVGQTAEYVRRA